jgi:hypothetical protein
MGDSKDFQKDQKQHEQEQPQMQPGGRKNTEEVGEPVQLNDDKSQKQGQQNKPGAGQREGRRQDGPAAGRRPAPGDHSVDSIRRGPARPPPRPSPV